MSSNVWSLEKVWFISICDIYFVRLLFICFGGKGKRDVATGIGKRVTLLDSFNNYFFGEDLIKALELTRISGVWRVEKSRTTEGSN